LHRRSKIARNFRIIRGEYGTIKGKKRLSQGHMGLGEAKDQADRERGLSVRAG